MDTHLPTSLWTRQHSGLTQLGVWPFEGVCHAPHSHPFSNEEQNSQRSLSLSKSRLCPAAHEKIAWTFANSVGLFLKIVISSLVCLCVCMRIGLCALRFVPSTLPTRNGFFSLVTSVKTHFYVFHPPLPASKAVLCSWSLVVICAPIAPGVTGITGWYDKKFVVPDTKHYIRDHRSIYMYENIGYVQRPERHLFATYWYHVWIY